MRREVIGIGGLVGRTRGNVSRHRITVILGGFPLAEIIDDSCGQRSI